MQFAALNHQTPVPLSGVGNSGPTVRASISQPLLSMQVPHLAAAGTASDPIVTYDESPLVQNEMQPTMARDLDLNFSFTSDSPATDLFKCTEHRILEKSGIFDFSSDVINEEAHGIYDYLQEEGEYAKNILWHQLHHGSNGAGGSGGQLSQESIDSEEGT